MSSESTRGNRSAHCDRAPSSDDVAQQPPQQQQQQQKQKQPAPKKEHKLKGLMRKLRRGTSSSNTTAHNADAGTAIGGGRSSSSQVSGGGSSGLGGGGEMDASVTPSGRGGEENGSKQATLAQLKAQRRRTQEAAGMSLGLAPHQHHPQTQEQPQQPLQTQPEPPQPQQEHQPQAQPQQPVPTLRREMHRHKAARPAAPSASLPESVVAQRADHHTAATTTTTTSSSSSSGGGGAAAGAAGAAAIASGGTKAISPGGVQGAPHSAVAISTRGSTTAKPSSTSGGAGGERRLAPGDMTDSSTVSIGVEDLSWEEEPGAFLRGIFDQQNSAGDGSGRSSATGTAHSTALVPPEEQLQSAVALADLEMSSSCNTSTDRSSASTTATAAGQGSTAQPQPHRPGHPHAEQGGGADESARGRMAGRGAPVLAYSVDADSGDEANSSAGDGQHKEEAGHYAPPPCTTATTTAAAAADADDGDGDGEARAAVRASAHENDDGADGAERGVGVIPRVRRHSSDSADTVCNSSDRDGRDRSGSNSTTTSATAAPAGGGCGGVHVRRVQVGSTSGNGSTASLATAHRHGYSDDGDSVASSSVGSSTARGRSRQPQWRGTGSEGDAAAATDDDADSTGNLCTGGTSRHEKGDGRSSSSSRRRSRSPDGYRGCSVTMSDTEDSDADNGRAVGGLHHRRHHPVTAGLTLTRERMEAALVYQQSSSSGGEGGSGLDTDDEEGAQKLLRSLGLSSPSSKARGSVRVGAGAGAGAGNGDGGSKAGPGASGTTLHDVVNNDASKVMHLYAHHPHMGPSLHTGQQHQQSQQYGGFLHSVGNVGYDALLGFDDEDYSRHLRSHLRPHLFSSGEESDAQGYDSNNDPVVGVPGLGFKVGLDRVDETEVSVSGSSTRGGDHNNNVGKGNDNEGHHRNHQGRDDDSNSSFNNSPSKYSSGSGSGTGKQGATDSEDATTAAVKGTSGGTKTRDGGASVGHGIAHHNDENSFTNNSATDSGITPAHTSSTMTSFSSRLSTSHNDSCSPANPGLVYLHHHHQQNRAQLQQREQHMQPLPSVLGHNSDSGHHGTEGVAGGAASYQSTPKVARPVARTLLPPGSGEEASSEDESRLSHPHHVQLQLRHRRSSSDQGLSSPAQGSEELDTSLLVHAKAIGLRPLPSFTAHRLHGIHGPAGDGPGSNAQQQQQQRQVEGEADAGCDVDAEAVAMEQGVGFGANVDFDGSGEADSQLRSRQDLSVSDFSFSGHFRPHPSYPLSPSSSSVDATITPHHPYLAFDDDVTTAHLEGAATGVGVDAGGDVAPGGGALVGGSGGPGDAAVLRRRPGAGPTGPGGASMEGDGVSLESLYGFHPGAQVPLFRVLPRPTSDALDESMTRHAEELEEVLAQHSDRLDRQRSPFYFAHGYESTQPRGVGQFTSKRFWPYPVPQDETSIPSGVPPDDDDAPANATQATDTTPPSASNNSSNASTRARASIKGRTLSVASSGGGSGGTHDTRSSGNVAVDRAVRYLQQCATQGQVAPPVLMEGCDGFVHHSRGGSFDSLTLYKFMEISARYYRLKMALLPHWNFTGEYQSEPVVVTIGLRNGERSSREVPCFLCMIRTIRRAYKGEVRPDELSAHPTAGEICRVAFPKLAIANLAPVRSDYADDVRQRLIAVDEHMIRDRFKVTLFHVLPGQLAQDAVLGNSDDDDTPGYTTFLQALGDRVPIASFAGYKGDLDGFKQSVHTTFDDKEIMFHVASLVSVVFLERGAHFFPKAFNFQLLHVYIVIQENDETREDGAPLYDVRVVSRDSVPWFDPVIPTEPLTAREMQRWTLNKIVNAEIAMQQSGALADVARQVREQQIRSAVSDFNAWKFAEAPSCSEVLQALREFAASCIVDVSSLPDTALCLPDKYLRDVALNHAVQREMDALRVTTSTDPTAASRPRTLAESKANRASTIERRRNLRGVSEGLHASSSSAGRSLRRSPTSVSTTSLASAFSEANGGVLVEGRGLNLDHIATLDVHEQVARLRKLVLTIADERDERAKEVRDLQVAKQELMESNIQLRDEISRLTKGLRDSKESFEQCYSENVRLARKVADLELELNMPAEV